MKSEREQVKESPRYINFPKSFRDLTKELSKAYSVSDDIYSQKASILRSEDGIVPNWSLRKTEQAPIGNFIKISFKVKNFISLLTYPILFFSLSPHLFNPKAKMTYNYHHGN